MKQRFITDCPLRRERCGSCGIVRTTLVIGKNGLCAPCLRAGADGIEYADHQRRVTGARATSGA